jgi:hypothetical protein
MLKTRGMQVNSLKQNKWVRRVVWVVGGGIVFWGLSWLLVPPIIKSQFEQRASEQLGRKVSLGKLDFKPWSLELTVDELMVARADGALDPSPQLYIKRFYIDAELQSLVRLAPVVDAITLDAPRLSLTHLGAGRYDVDDILTRLKESANKEVKKPDDTFLRFALYNLALSGGAVDFSDKSTGKTHELRDLQVKLPFLSNLDSMRSVLVQPQLAFILNGSRFDSSAQGTPFAQTRKTEATLKLSNLDLATYLAYVPSSLPVKLMSAVLNADLKVAFEQSPRVAVKLSGKVQASKVRLAGAGPKAEVSKGAESADADLLDFDLLKITLADVRPLERVARLAAVDLDGPRLNVRRNKLGQLDLAMLTTPREPAKTKMPESGGSASNAVNGTRDRGWTLEVTKVALRHGVIHWDDDTTMPPARLGLRDLTLDASDIALPFVRPLQFEASANPTPMASAAVAGNVQSKEASRVSFKGSATDKAASLTAVFVDLPLSLAHPYLASYLTPVLGGRLSAELELGWKASAESKKAPELLLQARQLTLDHVALMQGKVELASLNKLYVEQANVDLEHQRVTLGKLRLTQPKVTLSREPNGRWMVESWRKSPPVGTVAAAKSPVAVGKTRASPTNAWGVAIGDATLDGGTLKFIDQSVGKPVAFDLSALSVQLKNFSTVGSKPFLANVSTQIRTGKAEAGHIAWRGSAGLNPLAAQGRVEAARVPLHAFEPYMADAANIELLRAEVSFKGQVSYAQKPAGPVLKLSGDTTIEDFQANTLAAASDPLQRGEELLNWKALSVRGLEVALAPGTATTVSVKETVLSDFFARLILSETGRLNLQDVTKTPDTAAATVSVSAPAQAPTPAAMAPVINVGPISVTGGRVHFSDRFIKPNYSANLTELAGKLGAFSSQGPSDVVNLADLELRGRAEGTASLEILGKVNPLATPVALDIKGKVRDLELPPLSPYSIRYAGYGIERGKLSVDVAYLVQPNGQLMASNNIVLNQLTFGDKVDGAPTSLPVKLAVALLADRNGVIDINLPVSGSLSDPQFRLGPIVFKLIVNLIVKAITSPFSLLASAFGGGADELSVVNFAPGSALLAPEARPGLDKVAKALIERPALKMTVIGTASLEVERDAFKREQLNALVHAEKRRVAVLNGAPASAIAQGQGDNGVTEAEYPVLLKAVYRRADFPKPRNLVGMLKDIPVHEMEALLLAHLTATDDAMRELAVQRGVVVRDYLAAQKLPSDRLFLGAAKAVPPEAKWSPRAELNLSTR